MINQNMNKAIENKNFDLIREKVYNNKRLQVEDALFLFKYNDLISIGELANFKNSQVNGNRVYYIVNIHVNYTNICVNQCAFCAFYRKGKEIDAYTMNTREIIEYIKTNYKANNFREVHIVGGLHPSLPYSFYIDMICGIKKEFPNLLIQAFTAVEIDYLSKISGLSVGEVLLDLKNSGLDSLPGGGAEIFNPVIRRRLCPQKISGERWIQIHKIAHELGIPSNASMLYGVKESYEDRVSHLEAIRNAQDELAGFKSFIPFAFQPKNTAVKNSNLTSGYDDLKVIAISRLFLDNFKHIKTFFVNLGINLAQVSLSFGADDFDGTLVEEKISHNAGSTNPAGLSVKKVKKIIEETGNIPTERDTLYNAVFS
ncbi:MAG: aminofutalosine synthase MqnE [Deltaproteobacteria bacterium]|nr:aminofutalosine synthase MqnE [Deltaproteobacteria bacterium]MCL5880310.1 aminofutalosine synthase MqnE [Deltaproteobacteria bacterium]MDA8303956.1 aminofutalosine synthase MqnE [Deltaproteobacteria bacterium]